MRVRSRLLVSVLLLMVVTGCVSQLPGGPGSPLPTLPGGGGHPGGPGGPGGGNPGGGDPGSGLPGTSGTVMVAVSSSQDDGWRNNSVGNTEVVLYSLNGMWFGGSPGSYEASAFFRFRNVGIPAGSTILEAKVSVAHWPTYETGLNKWDTLVDIRGFAYDDMPVFSTTKDPNTLTRTVATVPWDIVEPWSNTEAEWHDTPDLTAVIQEIVDRPGWRAGNAVGIAFDYRTGPRPPGSLEYNRWIHTYESDSNFAPVLYVRYKR